MPLGDCGHAREGELLPSPFGVKDRGLHRSPPAAMAVAFSLQGVKCLWGGELSHLRLDQAVNIRVGMCINAV